MRNSFYFKIVLASFFLVFIGFITIVWGEGTRKNRATPVKVEKVIKRTVNPTITLIGTVEPSMKSTVASEVEGLVVDFSVRLGQRLKKGQVLAGLKKTPFSLALKQAQASLAEANENYQNALSELRSTEALFKRKTISSREYDAVSHRTNALKQRIMSLEARIEMIDYNLDMCVIRAPFSGFVVAEHTQVGQWLRKGGPVVTMADMDPVLVTVPVPDRYINDIKPGQTVDLEFEFIKKNGKMKGSLRNIVPQGNEKARTFPVQVLVDNKRFNILAGMSSRVSFPVGKAYEALLVNKDAFSTSGDGDNHHIFVVRDNEARSVRIKKGQAFGSLIVTEGGLSDGEMVVVEGNERLRTGQKVRVVGGDGHKAKGVR